MSETGQDGPTFTPEMFDKVKDALKFRNEPPPPLQVLMSVDAYAALPDPNNITYDNLTELALKGLL